MPISNYEKIKRIELGRQIKSKIKIYLDTKYWIEFCNFSLGKTTKNNFKEIYDLSYTLVQNGTVIFPISERVFHEIIKQTDKISFEKTVKIIDELSMGVSLISEKERINDEIFRFMYQAIVPSQDIYEKEITIWTKMVYILNFFYPENEYMTLEHQKKFFDYIWDISLMEIIQKIEFEKIQQFPKLKDISDQLNHDKLTYATENNSLQQLYMSEIGGTIDAYKDQIHQIMVSLFEQTTNSRYHDTQGQMEPANLLANCIYNLFLHNKIDLDFPTIDIHAKLHAMIRWDQGRKYKSNDLHDIGHASSALPYCDYFFTERSLAALITTIHYDQKYTCTVAWKENDILNILQSIYS
jgi:hypothetical protein